MITNRTLAILLLIAIAGCGDASVDAYRDINVTVGDLENQPDALSDSILAQEAFAYLPITASSDSLARAIVFYIHGAYEQSAPSSHRISTILKERKTDRMAAVRLGLNLAGQLGWEAKAIVLASAPTISWLLEVNSQDGRFLLDPYQGRIVTLGVSTDEMLGFPEALTQGNVFQAERSWPSRSLSEMDGAWSLASSASEQEWRELHSSADLAQPYTGVRSVALPVALDMSNQPLWAFGQIDRSVRDVEAIFAPVGDVWSHYAFWGGWQSLLGPVNLGHRLIVSNAVPGQTYRYDIAFLEDVSGLLLTSPQGARLGGWQHLAGTREWSLQVTAESSQVMLDMGLNAATQLSIDSFSFGAVTGSTSTP